MAAPPASTGAGAQPQGAGGRRARGDAKSSKLGGGLRTLFLIMLLAGSAVLFLGMGSVISPGKRSLMYPRPLPREQKRFETSTLSAIIKEHRVNNATATWKREGEHVETPPTKHVQNESTKEAQRNDGKISEKEASSADQTKALHNANIMKAVADNKIMAVGNQTAPHAEALKSESGTHEEPSSSGNSKVHGTTKSPGGFARQFMARTASDQTDVVGVPRPFRVDPGQQITLVMPHASRLCACVPVCLCACVSVCLCVCVSVCVQSYEANVSFVWIKLSCECEDRVKCTNIRPEYDVPVCDSCLLTVLIMMLSLSYGTVALAFIASVHTCCAEFVST
jgi:hypothetical protein